LADYVVRILKQYNTNINTLKQFATEQVGGAFSLALGLGNDTIMGNNKLRNKLNGALRLPLVVDFNATGVAAAAVEQPPQQPIPMNYTPQVENHFSFAGNGDAAAAQVPAAAHHPVPPFEGFGNVTNAPFTTPARRGLRQPPLTPGSTFQPSFAPQAGAGGILSNSSIQGLCQPPLTPGSTYQPSHFSTPSVSGMNERGQGYSAGGGSPYKHFSSYSQEENIHPNGSHWGGDEGSIGSLTNSLRISHISRNLASQAQVFEKLTFDIKQIRAKAEARIRDVNVQLEKDISECLQNTRRQLTDLEANVATAVWDQSVPAVDFASIWQKFHQVENNSKEPSGTNHY
jgi:hypothetical protein